MLNSFAVFTFPDGEFFLWDPPKVKIELLFFFL